MSRHDAVGYSADLDPSLVKRELEVRNCGLGSGKPHKEKLGEGYL
jgi:hypothetical protein